MLSAEVFYGIACCHSLSRFRDSFHSFVFMATMCGSLYRAGKVSLTCVIDSLFPQHYSVTNDPLEHLPGDFVIGENTQRRISDSEHQQERKSQAGIKR